MTKKIIILVLLSLMLVMLLSGCIPGDGKATENRPANFLWGIWHGWIAPVSLVVSLFNRSIRIYEAVNTGWWYDFGFYLAIIGGFGGLSLFRHKRNSTNRN